jgi:hypothetical protein
MKMKSRHAEVLVLLLPVLGIGVAALAFGRRAEPRAEPKRQGLTVRSEQFKWRKLKSSSGEEMSTTLRIAHQGVVPTWWGGVANPEVWMRFVDAKGSKFEPRIRSMSGANFDDAKREYAISIRCDVPSHRSFAKGARFEGTLLMRRGMPPYSIIGNKRFSVPVTLQLMPESRNAKPDSSR